MTEPTLRHVQCLDGRGLHRLAYWQWERANGASDRVLICAHGVSRQGRDFDTLAQAMQDGWRVVCPDFVGRGESDRLADPAAYVLPTYVADMVTLLARLDAKIVHWFGTSMGGLIGIAMAARGPKARVHEFAGVGHAPTIVAADQVAVVREFLQEGA